VAELKPGAEGEMDSTRPRRQKERSTVRRWQPVCASRQSLVENRRNHGLLHFARRIV